MYTFAGTAIAGLYYVDVHTMRMWNTRVQTGCLARVPAPSIYVYTNTPLSLVMDPLCYINLRSLKDLLPNFITSTY